MYLLNENELIEFNKMNKLFSNLINEIYFNINTKYTNKNNFKKILVNKKYIEYKYKNFFNKNKNFNFMFLHYENKIIDLNKILNEYINKFNLHNFYNNYLKLENKKNDNT